MQEVCEYFGAIMLWGAPAIEIEKKVPNRHKNDARKDGKILGETTHCRWRPVSLGSHAHTQLTAKAAVQRATPTKVDAIV